MASFEQQIRKYAEKYNERIEDTVSDFAVGLSSLIIKRTPVDTGRARGNWFPSIGSPSSSTSEAGGDSDGRVTGIKQQIPGSVYYLVNNLPYIRRLEYGWSDQAPEGMVRRSVREAKQELDRQVRKNRNT